ncbi:MAG: helix-turn-helix domain-containing protein [Chloroflexota bacterium]
MALSRYEVLERLSDLLSESAPVRSHSPPPSLEVSDLPATTRPVAAGTVATFPSLLLTIPEAAEQLRISRAQLYVLIKQGTVETVHIGKLARIPRSALEQYVENLRGQTRSALDTELCA